MRKIEPANAGFFLFQYKGVILFIEICLYRRITTALDFSEVKGLNF